MPSREVDFGWWAESDGRSARLTWREQGKHLFLFHAAGHSESLGAGIAEHDARAFVTELEAALDDDGSDRLVDHVRRAAGERWPF